MTPIALRCRMVACREALDDGREWSFYLLNDSAGSLGPLGVDEIACERGDMGSTERADVRVAELDPGAHALVWRDDGSGAELRMELGVRLQVHGHAVRLRFEFPKLYRQRDLPVVAGLGQRGCALAAGWRAPGRPAAQGWCARSPSAPARRRAASPRPCPGG